MGKTGVVGILEGKSTNKNKCILLRADMDALNLAESTDVEYQS